MPKFKCQICDTDFELPEAILSKFPGWTPKYCKEHSPKKKSENSNVGSKKVKKKSKTSTKDLSREEVLAEFTEGPKTGIFTDGGARPNPGKGAWGLVIVQDDKIIQEDSGSETETTNNRMELTAILNTFKYIKEDQEYTIYSDSNLCVQTFNTWAHKWAKNSWKKKSGEIKNLDLVKQVYELFSKNKNVQLKWVPGHGGWRWNEYADAVASSEFL